MQQGLLPYFGSIGMWAAWMAQGEATFVKSQRFVRRSPQTRTTIANSHGAQLLSLPLIGGRSQHGPLSEAQLSYTVDWPRQHLLSLRAAYGSAPFWQEYAADLTALYNSKPPRLWDFNLSALRWMAHQITPQLVFTEVETRNTDRLDTSGDRAVSDRWIFPSYPQVFSDRNPFLPNLSILDLLMCQGPAGVNYLARLPVD